jgi:hypothetical protein
MSWITNDKLNRGSNNYFMPQIKEIYNWSTVTRLSKRGPMERAATLSNVRSETGCPDSGPKVIKNVSRILGVTSERKRELRDLELDGNQTS